MASQDKGKFTFDFAYAPGSGQKEIYDDIGAPLARSVQRLVEHSVGV